MSIVTIPGLLANKANRYEVRVNSALWARIRGLVQAWKAETRQGPWWIAPSDEVKTYEQEVAYRFLAQERREWLAGEPLQLRVRLIAQFVDCDAIKAILDGIQRSGRIKNDRQFRRIVIEHLDGKKPSVEIEVEPA